MQDPVITTIKSYEIKAEEYIRNTDQLAYFPDLPAMLDKFIALLPGPCVLDVAFGAGRDTLYLMANGLSVQGVELTMPFIQKLKEAISVPLYKMDMRYLGFVNDCFDGIWCCSAFLHIPRVDALDTLRGFSRVLKPGGIIYLYVKEGHGYEWKSEGNINQANRYFTYYETNELTELLEQADIEVLFTRRQSHAKIQDKPGWINIIGQKRGLTRI